MHPSPSFLTAAQLVGLRVALAGWGAFRVEESPAGDVVIAILPGGESLARFTSKPMPFGAPSQHLGQLFYPTGRPLSVPLGLRDPARFASIMHNVDCEIMRGGHNLPLELLVLADRLASSPDPRIDDLVMRLGDRPLDFPTPADGQWALPALGRVLLEAARDSADLLLVDAANQLAAVVAGDAPARPFDERESLARWHEQVDDWVMAEHGIAATRVAAGDGVWQRLETVAGVTAAARRLGQLEGDILECTGAPMAHAETLRKVRAMLTDKQATAATNPLLPPDGRGYYALRDGAGTLLAIAVHDGDDVIVRGPRGVEASTAFATVAATVALRGALGLDPDVAPEAPPAPGPRA